MKEQTTNMGTEQTHKEVYYGEYKKEIPKQFRGRNIYRKK